MLLAAHLAGLGQASGTGVGAVHAIGHAIGTRGRLPHGTALATVLPEVLATYLGVRERELALVAVALSRGRARAIRRPRPRGPRSTGIDALLRARRPAADAPRARASARTLEASIVADALDDAAIANSPRLPSADEIAAILAAVRADVSGA